MKCVIRDLYKSYGETEVLRNVSLTLESGVAYALSGPSGIGKTTLFRLLSGLEKPDSGKIEMPLHVRFSYAFQEPRLFGQLTVRQNIQLVAPQRSAEEILALLNLADTADKLPGKLSGGMKKRAALARALASEADMYLIDEPTAGQDAEHAGKILEAIRRYTSDAICIVATHDAEFLRCYADTVLLFRDGRLQISDGK